MTYPDGNTATFAYNHLNQMKSLSDWLGNTSTFTYDSAGICSPLPTPPAW